MTPRQARRERRAAERKAKKLELKRAKLSDPASTSHPESLRDSIFAEHPEIQPHWNVAGQPSCAWSADQHDQLAKPQRSALHGLQLELEDEFPPEQQIRANAIADLATLQAGFPLSPPGPTEGLRSDASLEEIRAYYSAKHKAAKPKSAPPLTEPAEIGFVSQKSSAQPVGGVVRDTASAQPVGGVVRDTTSAQPVGGVVRDTDRSCRAEINRANAQFSTGPTSTKGKADEAAFFSEPKTQTGCSSRNSTKHGLTSGAIIIPGEDPAAFDALLNGFLEEHQPATLTEETLVYQMAQSHWLTQRAIRLQNDCFTAGDVDQKQLALYLRYQTTHQRSFYKALDTLLKLNRAKDADARRETEKGTRCSLKGALDTAVLRGVAKKVGFVSQSGPEPPTNLGFVSQNTPEPFSEPPLPEQEQAA